jgi:NADPH:quinone reductase-like Zn-dependent oxidoreductase
MKAVIYTDYGSPDQLRYTDIAKPTPKDNEALIKIHATGLNALDWHLLRADPFFVRLSSGLFRPKKTILGADFAGQIEAVGKDVTKFQVGDAVFACRLGGLAENICMPETDLVLKPSNLSFEQAAAVPTAALTALQALRNVGKIQPGQKVLIHGASGGVGTFAVQIAKVFGAEVTAVCSTAKMELARQLGADHVIDYTREDFSMAGVTYDLILAANGNRKLADYERALTPTGTFVMAGGTNSQMFQAIFLGRLKSKAGGKNYHIFVANENATDLAYLKDLIEAGRLMPVMDRCYPLSQTAEAMRYLEAGHAKGKIVVNVQHPATA